MQADGNSMPVAAWAGGCTLDVAIAVLEGAEEFLSKQKVASYPVDNHMPMPVGQPIIYGPGNADTE